MNTKIWKYPTNDQCTDVYVETKIFAHIGDSTEVEITNAHMRAAREAFCRYGEPCGVYPTGHPDEVETLPSTRTAVASLSNTGSAETPFWVDATVYEAPADARATSLAAAKKKQQESMQHASEMPVNALDAECLIAVNDASSNLYEIIYGLEAAIDMEDGEYCISRTQCGCLEKTSRQRWSAIRF